jgi:hypothetical protein
VHFGLFLQKINILKDFMDDSKAGRNFLWSWQDVAQTLPIHAKEAFLYVEKIEATRDDYKVFCAWSFYLGLLSYPSIEKSLKTGKKEKISRLEAWQMLNVVKKNILKKDELKKLFEKLSAPLLQIS